MQSEMSVHLDLGKESILSCSFLYSVLFELLAGKSNQNYNQRTVQWTVHFQFLTENINSNADPLLISKLMSALSTMS